MTGLAARLRFILGALAVCGLIAFCAPARAQQPLIDPDTSVVNSRRCFDNFRALKDKSISSTSERVQAVELT